MISRGMQVNEYAKIRLILSEIWRRFITKIADENITDN